MNNYNPLKMWGSYIGLLASLIFVLKGFWSPLFGYDYNMIFFKLSEVPILIVMYVILIMGFFIGYGIHSLFRYLNKSKKVRT